MEQTFYFEDPATVSVFHLAICQVCRPILPLPFESATDRTKWARIHGGATGHAIREATEIRVTMTDRLPAQGPLGMLGS